MRRRGQGEWKDEAEVVSIAKILEIMPVKNPGLDT